VGDGGVIEERMRFNVIPTQEEASVDFWNGMLVFLRTGLDIFESERLYVSWPQPATIGKV